MSSRPRLAATFTRLPLELAQIFALCALYMAIEWMVTAVRAPVPANVAGVVALGVLLATRAVRVAWVGEGARPLLRYMSLLFVPSVVGVMQHGPALAPQWLRLAAAVVASTAITMSTTALVARHLLRRSGDADGTA
jgi:holin-like protein